MQYVREKHETHTSNTYTHIFIYKFSTKISNAVKLQCVLHVRQDKGNSVEEFYVA